MAAITKTHLAPDEDFIGRIDSMYGVQLIKRGGALDHARMRSTQLEGLLTLIQGEEYLEGFKTLRDDLQESLIWMALQTARDLGAAVELVADDAKGDTLTGVDGLPPDQHRLLRHYVRLSDSARDAVVDAAQCFTENPDNLRPAPGDAS
jgi:hypothetical protein